MPLMHIMIAIKREILTEKIKIALLQKGNWSYFTYNLISLNNFTIYAKVRRFYVSIYFY